MVKDDDSFINSNSLNPQQKIGGLHNKHHVAYIYFGGSST